MRCGISICFKKCGVILVITLGNKSRFVLMNGSVCINSNVEKNFAWDDEIWRNCIDINRRSIKNFWEIKDWISFDNAKLHVGDFDMEEMLRGMYGGTDDTAETTIGYEEFNWVPVGDKVWVGIIIWVGKEFRMEPKLRVFVGCAWDRIRKYGNTTR